VLRSISHICTHFAFVELVIPTDFVHLFLSILPRGFSRHIGDLGFHLFSLVRLTRIYDYSATHGLGVVLFLGKAMVITTQVRN